MIDNGVGITRDDRKKLFKLFGKVTNTRGMNTQGIGLGLVISENIVNQFGGQIGVRSCYGKGTHFAFSFLLAESLEESDVWILEKRLLIFILTRIIYIRW